MLPDSKDLLISMKVLPLTLQPLAKIARIEQDPCCWQGLFALLTKPIQSAIKHQQRFHKPVEGTNLEEWQHRVVKLFKALVLAAVAEVANHP